MKKLCLALACAVMFSSVAMAQQEMPQKQRPAMPAPVMERMQKQMTERYSKMNPEQLTRRKGMIEKRLANEKNERAKQRLQIELDTINSLIQQ